MCIGASASRGEVLLFLHADSTLQSGALDRISEVLSADASIIGGNFRLVFDAGTRFSRWLTRFCAVIRMLGTTTETRGSLSVARCMTLSADFVRCR